MCASVINVFYSTLFNVFFIIFIKKRVLTIFNSWGQRFFIYGLDYTLVYFGLDQFIPRVYCVLREHELA